MFPYEHFTDMFFKLIGKIYFQLYRKSIKEIIIHISAYYVQDTILRTLHIMTHFILISMK